MILTMLLKDNALIDLLAVNPMAMITSGFNSSTSLLRMNSQFLAIMLTLSLLKGLHFTAFVINSPLLLNHSMTSSPVLANLSMKARFLLSLSGLLVL